MASALRGAARRHRISWGNGRFHLHAVRIVAFGNRSSARRTARYRKSDPASYDRCANAPRCTDHSIGTNGPRLDHPRARGGRARGQSGWCGSRAAGGSRPQWLGRNQGRSTRRIDASGRHSRRGAVSSKRRQRAVLADAPGGTGTGTGAYTGRRQRGGRDAGVAGGVQSRPARAPDRLV